MPIYEYQCSQCGEVFEAFQKVHDAPLTECRSCHGRVEKLISHSSFQLKGSGWYLTDYARKSQPSSTPGDSKSTDKSSKGTESKPASPSSSAGTKTD